MTVKRMNRRDFLKGTLALSTAPAIFNICKAENIMRVRPIVTSQSLTWTADKTRPYRYAECWMDYNDGGIQKSVCLGLVDFTEVGVMKSPAVTVQAKDGPLIVTDMSVEIPNVGTIRNPLNPPNNIVDDPTTTIQLPDWFIE